jgi:hypothetical protein
VHLFPPEAQIAEYMKHLTLHESRSHYPDHRYVGDSKFAIEPVKDRRGQFLVNLKLCLIALMRDRCCHEIHTSRALTLEEIEAKFKAKDAKP